MSVQKPKTRPSPEALRTGSSKGFIEAVSKTTLTFPDNDICRRILADKFSMDDYQQLLVKLFHQSADAPSISAMAAANCPANLRRVRDHLLMIAHTGAEHRNRLLSDLEATGYSGPSPENIPPAEEVENYTAFNFYLAYKAPIGRLGVVAALEAIASSFSQNYSTKLMQSLGLKKKQASFFLREYTERQEVSTMDFLRQQELTLEDWGWLTHAAQRTGQLYRAMYETNE